MRTTLAAIALLGAAALAPNTALAWGKEGHEIIGLAALRILQTDAPDVAEKVTELLAADQDTLTTHDIGSEATWADIYRDRGPKPKSATADWHFVDIETEGAGAGDIAAACAFAPVQPGQATSDGPAKSCVSEEFRQELADPATPANERLLALKFLLHLVGDVHQPLHAADHRDRGGNCVGVLAGHSTRPSKLHSFWDTTVVVHAVSGNQERGVEAVFALVTPENKKAWQSDDPDRWALESFTLAKTAAYDLPQPPEMTGFEFPPQFGKPDSCGPVSVFRLSTEYEQRAERVATEQLAKAAVRLAFLLQQQLD